MSTNCNVCSLPCVSDGSDMVVKCVGGCNNSFHIKCIRDDLEGKKTRSYKDWKCKDCRSTSSAQSSTTSSASTAITKDFLISVIEQFKEQITRELKEQIARELKVFKTEMGDLATSVKFVSEKLDESTKLMKEIKNELATVKKENEDLRARNLSLMSDVTSLKDKVRSLEQYSRKNNLEIRGIPVTKNENVAALVKDVEAALGTEVQEGDITAAHRVPSYRKDSTPSIIVQFLRKSSRDTWLSKYKEKKGMTANQINTSFPRQPIYINEHLSPENKVFLSTLKSKCKEIGYSYAWCRDGKFFVRKQQGDRYRRVDTFEEINKLK